jgi:SNF2 family DNA or RNA helicase
VDGRVPSDERLRGIDSWANASGVAVLVAGIGAVGIGLSLSAAETSVKVEIPWRPEQLDQFVARFNDAEHDHAGLLVPIIIEGSREERAVNRYITKRDDIDSLVAVSSTEAQTKKAFEREESDEDVLKELAL